MPQSIFEQLHNVLQSLEVDWSAVISVCFDGAATMSVSIAGVHRKCKGKKNSSIQYVHCYAHCLNLVLVQACTSRKENPILFNFCRVVQSIYTFIEGSCSRHAVLEKVAADVGLALKTLKSVSTTRWARRAEAVPTLRNNYPVILIALEEITNTTQHFEVSANGHGPLYQMKTFEFVFSLEMMHPILQLILQVRPFKNKTLTCCQQ
jgi:hypothetical protein